MTILRSVCAAVVRAGVGMGADMNIITEPTPDGGFLAYDDDSFDGPGSPIGYGPTPEAATWDLRSQLEEA